MRQFIKKKVPHVRSIFQEINYHEGKSKLGTGCVQSKGKARWPKNYPENESIKELCSPKIRMGFISY